MAEIILDLTGRKGLADTSAGDADMITAQPNLNYIAKEGQLATGFYNPYIRLGYLAPVPQTRTDEYVDDVSNKIVATQYDAVNETAFFAEEGKIWKSTPSGALTVTTYEPFLSSPGKKINDLDVYTIKNARHLFYTYLDDNIITEFSSNLRADWSVFSIVVGPTAGQKITASDFAESYLNSASPSATIQVDSTSDVGIVVVAVQTSTVSAATFGGVAMSLVDSSSRYTDGAIWNYYIYKAVSIASTGSKTIAITNSSAAPTVINAAMIRGANSVTPTITVYETNGVSFNPIIRQRLPENSGVLTFANALNSRFDIANITVGTDFNPSAQTSTIGAALMFSADGTKMYVDGTNGSNTTIYQYTLSTAWLPSTATYASLSKNIDAQINDTVGNMHISPTGHRFMARGYTAGSAIHSFSVTSGDISTATATTNYTVSEPGLTGSFGFAISSDGKQMYVCNYFSELEEPNWIYQYTLGTAWSASTATFKAKLAVPDLFNSLAVGADDSIILLKSLTNEQVYSYNFNPLYPKDISKATLSVTGSNQIVTLPETIEAITLQKNGGKLFGRSGSDDNIVTYNMTTGSNPTISSTNIEELSSHTATKSSLMTFTSGKKLLDIGVTSLPVSNITIDNTAWLTETQGEFIQTSSDYNFIRLADNGLAYVFTSNRVHVIDGGSTGGENGVFTKDVLVFPDYFTITDAVDYRSNIYMAVHHYPVNKSGSAINTYGGKCGIVLWNRLSTQLGGVDFIELPGVREIKRIYISPDQVLKLVVVADSGLTEVREFGYNDSGGVVFRPFTTLGIGAYPETPECLTIASDKIVWLGNDGTLYAEKGNAVTKLFEFSTYGTTSAGVLDNISGGAVYYGYGDDTASAGLRSNKQSIFVSYYKVQSGADFELARIYPFDIGGKANATQYPNQGDVFTGITFIPITSVLRQVRIYNAPITGTGSGVIATVKLYFNQSTTVGMTKTITKDEAKRGYVDFHINKPYVHAVQLEVEWNTSEPIGADMYLPSVAIITHDPTTTKSPDNG